MEKRPEQFYISDDEAGIRLDLYIAKAYPDLSRSFVQKQIKSENILVNKKSAKNSQILKTSDEILINFQLENETKILPENIEIPVLYEDELMAVVVKPKNMLTHPTPLEKTGTLVNALISIYGKNLSDCNGVFRPGIVHRLDRNTSGLLMIAKTNEAYDALKKQMQAHTIEKKYYAVVSGNIQNDNGTINQNIGRHLTKPSKMGVRSDGKSAVTHFKVIERLNGYTFLEISLETGRTHQIRVHFSHIGHPIVNDTLYGGANIPVKTTEQVLQAYSLKFVSPFDNKEHNITIDPDCDIIKTLNYLRNRK